MEVPQIPFVDRVLDIPVMPQRRARTVQTVQMLGDSTAQFLDKVDDARCCQRQVHGLVSAETCGGPAVAVFDLVVDVPGRQSEVPQIQLLTFLGGGEGFFAAFFGLLLTELSTGLQRTFWGALDDEEFFVVEGSGVAGTPGV